MAALDARLRGHDGNGGGRSVLELSADLGGKIGGRLLDALAEDEADEPGDPDWRTGFLGGGLDDLADPAFAIDHEDLLEQHGFLVEFAQPSLDHALDDGLGLAAFFRLL